MLVDKKSAIALMKNLVFHGRTKHINTRFHFICECVEGGQIIVDFIRTEEQRADPLTKALSAMKLATMVFVIFRHSRIRGENVAPISRRGRLPTVGEQHTWR